MRIVYDLQRLVSIFASIRYRLFDADCLIVGAHESWVCLTINKYKRREKPAKVSWFNRQVSGPFLLKDSFTTVIGSWYRTTCETRRLHIRLMRAKRLMEICFMWMQEVVSAVGFEPTRSKTSRPERNRLDYSGKQMS